MANEKLDAESVRQESRNRLGEGPDYSYITDELVAQDAARNDDPRPFGKDDAAVNTTWYGNNARYGAREVDGVTYQGYWFENDGYGNPDGCSTAYTGFVTVNWNHQYLGVCQSGRERWAFSI